MSGNLRLAAPVVLATIGAALSTACVDSSRDPEPLPAPQAEVQTPAQTGPEDEFDTPAMLANLADAVIVPNYETLHVQTAALAAVDGPLAGYCAAIGTAAEDAARADAQGAWRRAMAAVQATEVHVLGPALADSETLRRRILSYSDSTLSTCGVDQAAVLATETDFAVGTRSLNQRGFGALEYLLFNDDLGQTCPPQVATVARWDALDEGERRSARCELALLLAEDAADAAASIVDRWGDYRGEFLDASATGDALQEITDAIFALDTLVKDRKLGIPTGIHDDCSSFSCAGLVESPYSGNSLANVRGNVASFQRLFDGGDGPGFDDLMAHEDFADVARRFADNSRAVLDLVDASDTTLYDQVLAIDSAAGETDCINAFANPDGESDLPACALVGLIKRITDDLKIDFVTIVNVSLPGSAQTDND